MYAEWIDYVVCNFCSFCLFWKVVWGTILFLIGGDIYFSFGCVGDDQFDDNIVPNLWLFLDGEVVRGYHCGRGWWEVVRQG